MLVAFGIKKREVHGIKVYYFNFHAFYERLALCKDYCGNDCNTLP